MFAPHPEPPLWAWLLLGAVEFAIRIVALGVVPKHRRASTSTAWLLLIFLWPFLGVPLYFIFGSWWPWDDASMTTPRPAPSSRPS